MAWGIKRLPKHGWQDVEIGGPGFCFPVMRWNGKQYAVLRHEDRPRAPQR